VFHVFFGYICKEQKDLKMKNLRSGKGAFCIYKAIYFAWATSWGYIVLKDQFYMPKFLGGSGDLFIGFRDFPFAHHAP